MNHQHDGSTRGRSPRDGEGPGCYGPRRHPSERAVDARGGETEEELLPCGEADEEPLLCGGTTEELLPCGGLDEELLLWRICHLLASMPDALDDTAEDQGFGAGHEVVVTESAGKTWWRSARERFRGWVRRR
ncbi:hypothetical protein [Streptomyces hydrogenans]|uniref:hypothetical protein n=1 Tax=Streptomyces hydrogenans TaxID=1873719 RepID=UPI0033BCD3E6